MAINNEGLCLFVVGTQRSGTTLLCRMLTSHPELFIQNELDVRQIFKDSPSKSEIINNIRGLMEKKHGCDLQTLLGEAGKQLWGLKDPELTDHLDELVEFMPETKFVFIVRDARAVVASYIDNRWGLGTNAYTGSLRWMREVKAQMKFKEEHPDNVLLLRYEDLVVQAEPELRKICEFLSLEFNESMLKFYEKPAFYHQGRENKNTYKALDKSITEKWKTALDEKEKSIVAHVCEEILKEHSYEIEEVPYEPTPFEIKKFNLHQKILGELQIQYKFRLGALKERLRKPPKR